MRGRCLKRSPLGSRSIDGRRGYSTQERLNMKTNMNKRNIISATTDNEIDRVQEFFNSDPIREELHTFTYRDGLNRAVDRDDRRLYYTEDQGTITSAAMVWCESRVLADDEAQIRLIATHPEYRHQGLATQLTNQAFVFASDWDKDRMKIEAAADEPAADFWQDLGFEIREHWETDNGREMITMERTIRQRSHRNDISRSDKA